MLQPGEHLHRSPIAARDAAGIVRQRQRGLETAERVHEPDLPGVETAPDAALSHGIGFRPAEPAALDHAAQEQLVGRVHLTLVALPLLGSEIPVRRHHVGMLAARHRLDV